MPTLEKARKLTKLKLDRVDLVPNGANPDAHIQLFKSATADIEKATFQEMQDARLLGKMLNEVCQYTYDLQDAIYSSLYSSGDQAAEVMTSIDQFSAAVNKALASWVKGKPVYRSKDETGYDLVESALTKMAERITTIRKAKEASVSASATVPEPIDIQKQIDEAVAKAKAENETAIAAAVAKAKEESDTKIAEIQKTANEATETARVEKEKREKAEFTAKAEKDYNHLPGKPEEIGDALLALKKAVDLSVITKEQHEHILKMFAAGEGALKLATKEEGSDSARTGEQGAAAELTVKAEEIRKENPKLSAHQARTKAYEDNPELFKQMRLEQGGRRVVEEGQE